MLFKVSFQEILLNKYGVKLVVKIIQAFLTKKQLKELLEFNG